MEPDPYRFPLSRSVRRTPAVLGWSVVGILVLSLAGPSRADIYRWEDSQGMVHFTDDITNIPPQYRKDSSLLIREAPSSLSPSQVSPPGGGPEPPPSGTVRGTTGRETEEAPPAEQEKEELASRVKQLSAKIAAKEEHIRAVDAKRSLAVNPLRNRFVSPEDMDLYRKYKEELPADKEQLEDLKTTLESVK